MTVFETINTTGKRLTVFDLLVARCYPANMNLRDKLDIALDRVSIKLFDPEGEGIAPVAIPRIISLKEKETARRGEILELEPEHQKKLGSRGRRIGASFRAYDNALWLPR